MKCALVIGHNKEDQGAKNSYSGLTEWQINSLLAIELQRIIKKVDIEIVYRDDYKDLPDKINALEPDFIISLHCNAHDCTVSGSETLQWHNSEKGTRLASILQGKINRALQNRNRGVKLVKKESDRGGHLLKNTVAPCVILEPFFIDNIEELQNALRRYKELSMSIAQGINEYCSRD